MSLTLLVGPSGVGKTVVWQKLLQSNKIMPFKTHTSRLIREEEQTHGFIPQYHFHSKEDFLRMISDGLFFEHEYYVDNYYGTIRSDIETALTDSKIWLGVVDIKGAKTIKMSYPNVKTIFLVPPSPEELLRRLKSRKTESEEATVKRFDRAKFELAQQNDLDYKIINDNLLTCLDEINKIIYL